MAGIGSLLDCDYFCSLVTVEPLAISASVATAMLIFLLLILQPIFEHPGEFPVHNQGGEDLRRSLSYKVAYSNKCQA